MRHHETPQDSIVKHFLMFLASGLTRYEVHVLYSRCPFLFEVDVASLVRAFCDVELRAHALSAVLVITTQSERNRATQV